MSKSQVEADGNMAAPIQVEVTEFEAAALAEAGDAMDAGIRDFVFLKLMAQGARADEAAQLAEQVSEAALRARRRIEEARRYALKIVPVVGESGGGAPPEPEPEAIDEHGQGNQ